jgi:hypothetical protein
VLTILTQHLRSNTSTGDFLVALHLVQGIYVCETAKKSSLEDLATRLGSGPNPILNLWYAVARVLKMSGAAEMIFQLMEDGDDTDFPHVYIASEKFCNILTAKLLVSGPTLIM